ncbi:SusC/RagA family TonB-linked outer membrane protein [Mariniflexile sp. AS56]|uniref:SusC/RagA family TonB-linked outer membrane protein n=1 Tax=Mariniflexile sp. AS56 TaxID=3063957 RepID=UPI0026F1D58F|nr:TonB-dependent receptor [Mariniflexile sp. AS56]MDO7173107.1 TonB-dependent receptor [Mariniflexile sp. AS56]
MKNHLNLEGNTLYSLKFDLKLRLTICLIVCSLFQIHANTFSEIEKTEIGSIQKITVTGTVSDANGPLPGVNIIVKGTTVGAQTDFDGNYSITVDNNQAVLVFSYIGYSTKEVVVGNNKSIIVVLDQDTAKLDEVVVVGYTTRKRGDITGSISTINAEEIQNTANKDVAKSLSGKVSGLIVVDRGGYPGSTDSNDLTLLIRGKSTLNNNSPLILIDGVPNGSFSQLAPQDIESLSVLKDGAAAIYGTRAANGVILITTKRGKSGKPKFNFSTSYSVSKFSAFPDQMNSEQYAIYENEIAARKNVALPFTQADITKYADGSDPLNFPNTNWADLTFAKSSPETRHSLSISGGNENVNYFVSGDALKQQGIYKSGDLNFDQYQLRSNIDIKLFEDFKLGVDVSGRVGESNEPGVDRANIYKHIYTNRPTDIGVYPNGLPGFGGENGQNPVIMTSNASGFVNRITNNLNSRISYEWKMDKFVEGLSLRGFASLGQTSYEQKDWDKPWTYYQLVNGEYVPSQGFQVSANRVLNETFNRSNTSLLNSTLHYSTLIGDDHSLSAFVGYEQSETKNRSFFAQRTGFTFDTITELDLGSSTLQTNGGTSQTFAFVSYFGSMSYDFQKKYFIDLTLRRDGSSRFAPGYKFGTFPGVAVSWAIDKESFMENVNWVNSLKIRASWSIMGNDRVNQFQYLNRYDFGYPSNNQGNGWYQPNGYVFGTPGVQVGGFGRANVPNGDITWETAEIKNLGLSYAFFDSRLSGDFNYFYQKRTDILVQDSSIPDITGLTLPNLPDENLGEVNNSGWELELAWNDEIGKVGYNVGFNFTKTKNEVVNLGESANVPDYRKREGRSIDSYIVYPTAGIFRDQAQVDATAVKKPGTVEGEPIYLDTNGDNKIDAEDRIRVNSSAIPEIQYGIYGGLTFSNWNFNFLLQGQAEAEVLVFFDQSGAKPDFVFNDRWTPNNRDASYPRAFGQGDSYSALQSTGPNQVNSGFEGADFYLKDGSFLRLKEIELGYTLTKDVTKFADIKISVRGFNLFTMFSEIYDLGLDPEATGYNNFRNSTYPSLKSVTLGLNINF